MGNVMAQQWYVVHTYSGFENRAKQNLEERIRNLGKGDFFSTILVPTETVVELVKGKRKTSQRKIFPGYIHFNGDIIKARCQYDELRPVRR